MHVETVNTDGKTKHEYDKKQYNEHKSNQKGNIHTHTHTVDEDYACKIETKTKQKKRFDSKEYRDTNDQW